MAEEGDIFTLLQIDDLMLLTRRQPRVPTLTEHFTAEMENAAAQVDRFLTLNTRDFTPEVATQSGLVIQTPAQFITELRDLVTAEL